MPKPKTELNKPVIIKDITNHPIYSVFRPSAQRAAKGKEIKGGMIVRSFGERPENR